MPPRRPEYRWDEVSGRYRNTSTGRYLSHAQVRAYVDAAIDARSRYIVSLSDQLRSGKLTLDQWTLEMRRAVKDVHIYNAMAAKGGRAQMTPADFGRVGALVKQEYAYLNRFRQQLDAGLPRDGRMTQRAVLYSNAGRHTYDVVQRHDMEVRGMNEERSILHPADHCQQCIDEAALGWVAIGTVIPIGERTCKANCRCSVEYRAA